MKIAVAGGTGTVGRHVVSSIEAQGHEAVVFSRSTGVDLVAGTGLDLGGVDAVIDVSSTSTQSGEASEAFFVAVTRNLLASARMAGVGNYVALGIVGSLEAPYGYYAGKKVQEELVSSGDVPWTILRATQFHEFAQQVYGQIKVGPIILIPKMVSQPVAAREVAERLVALAVAPPAGRVPDLAGPRVERMIDMVRALRAATHGPGPLLEVPAPGPFGKALRDGTLLPGDGATLGEQTYAQWLASLLE